MTKEIKVTEINDFEEFKKYFDVNILDEDNCPKIIAKENCIFVFDNYDNNETYLLDLVKKYIEPYEKYEKLNVFYINDCKTRFKMFMGGNTELENELDFELDYQFIEKKYLIPTLILLNADANQLTVFQETIIPFTEEMLKTIFTWLD